MSGLGYSETSVVPGWDKAKRIDGWFEKAEARLLSELCNGLWVEIGCYKGRSTTILAETGHPGYAIDTFTSWTDDSGRSPSNAMRYGNTYVEFIGNMADYENVIIVQDDFEHVSPWLIPDKINLLHLDADHSYEQTKLAWEKFSPKVESGGHVAFHDGRGGYWPGVEKVIEEIDRQEWQEGPTAHLLVTFQRL